MNFFEGLMQGLIKGASGIGEFFNSIGQGWKGLTGQTSAEAQMKANQENIAFQREVNAQQQYNLEHAHQIEAADLQAAGLNPWLSVGGGAQQANLQTQRVEAVDGSKMLQATTAAALLAVIKLATTKF